MRYKISVLDNVLEGEVFPVPEITGQFAFTLADDFLPPASLQGMTDVELKQHPELWPFGVFREARNNRNIPATVTTYKKGAFTKSTPWLEYWASNCALAWFDVWDYNDLRGTPVWEDFEKTWLWLTKGSEVITNKNGWDNGYYDPVSGQNKGSSPMGIDALLMERNVIKMYYPKSLFSRIISSIKNFLGISPSPPRLEKYGGILGYLFECFDGSQTPPDIRAINYRNTPTHFHRANIMMGRELYPNDHLGINPFPHGWQYNAHTPLPAVCMPNDKLPGGVNLVPQNRVHLTNGEVTIIDYVPNPYNPERTLR